MADYQTAMSTVTSLQSIFTTLASLSLTSDICPPDIATDELETIYDYIVVGGGSAGCVVASRLTEDPNNTVLMLEAGDCMPLESLWGGLFPIQIGTESEWRQNAAYDERFGQNLINNVVPLEQGHMLGGSSSLNHMIMVRGNKLDYDTWVNRTGDSTWSYDNLLDYFKKVENMRDQDIIENYSSYHGTSGPVYMNRQQSTYNVPILNAFEELNNTILIDINNPNSTLGFLEPTLTLDKGIRYSSPRSYLTPNVNRTNLHVKYKTTGTQIIFDSNNTAVGVKILDSDNNTRTIRAQKEIIVSAGVVKSPQVLALSGVGNKDMLDNLGIDIVSELPVGETLWDHVGAVSVYTLCNVSSPTSSSYSKFPVPMTTGYISLNSNEYPHVQSINLLFPKNSSGLMQLLGNVFKYKEDICDKLHNVNEYCDVLVFIVDVLRPYSNGNVTINSTDPNDYPTVQLGLLSDERDIDVLGEGLFYMNSIVNTTYFQNYSSEMVDLNLTNCNGYDKTTLEYFKCYGKEMSTSIWHPCGSCPMGPVLNSDLTVKNTTNLRVVDASSMPYTVSGNILWIIYALAEKAADLIKQANSG